MILSVIIGYIVSLCNSRVIPRYLASVWGTKLVFCVCVVAVTNGLFRVINDHSAWWQLENGFTADTRKWFVYGLPRSRFGRGSGGEIDAFVAL